MQWFASIVLDMRTSARGSAQRAFKGITAMVCAVFAASSLPTLAQIPGSLDTAFAGNGRVVFAIGSEFDSVTALALQPDGKIVLAGVCSTANIDNICLARLNPDGSLDASFDGPSGTGNGKFMLAIGTSGVASALALQPDGKIVVAGTCWTGNDRKFCLARLNPDGSLDASFDGPDVASPGNGKFLLQIGSASNSLGALSLQLDGKIVVAGACWEGSLRYFCVARMNIDGSLDTSFDGPDTVTPGNGKFALPFGMNDGGVASIALQTDGKILLGGSCLRIGGVFDATHYDFCFARLNVDGSFDTTFDGPNGNGNGKFQFTVLGSSDDYVSRIVLQPDGKVVAAGTCDLDFCLARLNVDGSLDTSLKDPNNFGDGKLRFQLGSSSDAAADLILQPDGKVLIAGFCTNTTANNQDFCLARLQDDGSLDTSFDGSNSTLPGNGKFLLQVGSSDDRAYAITLQRDGKIILAGSCRNDQSNINEFCVARLHGGPFSARNCTLDIDGDGLVTATTDMLIHTRVALGLRGATVIGGINFPANSTRNTWPQIRDYLVSQCGMSVY
jgi:uncharacterized delta-60 repeat protein